MTPLRRRIVRLVDLGERRPVVLTIHPNGLLEFRQHRRRRAYATTLLTAYGAALRADVNAQLAERRRRVRQGGRPR